MFSPYWTELTGDFGGPKICRLPAARSPRHHTNFPSPSLNRFLSSRGSMFIVTDYSQTQYPHSHPHSPTQRVVLRALAVILRCWVGDGCVSVNGAANECVPTSLKPFVGPVVTVECVGG